MSRGTAYRLLGGEFIENGRATNVFSVLHDQGRLQYLSVDRPLDKTSVAVSLSGDGETGSLALSEQAANTLFEALGTVLGRAVEKRKEAA